MELVKDTVDIGVLVRDIDACLDFYTKTLGFPKIGEVKMGERTQHRIQIGNAMLKLMQFPEGAAPPAGPRGRTAQAGIRYLTVHVKDVPSLVKELEAKGITFVMPVTKAATGATVAMFEDPEGNTIEIASAPSA
jgi:catechol 2,3-dioxygenase-like lactoylglutathione lyase family enzyme